MNDYNKQVLARLLALVLPIVVTIISALIVISIAQCADPAHTYSVRIIGRY